MRKRRADSSDQITGSGERHGFGCAVFVFGERQRGLNSEGAEKSKERSARCRITGEAEVEVLQPSLSDGFRMTTARVEFLG